MFSYKSSFIIDLFDSKKITIKSTKLLIIFPNFETLLLIKE